MKRIGFVPGTDAYRELVAVFGALLPGDWLEDAEAGRCLLTVDDLDVDCDGRATWAAPAGVLDKPVSVRTDDGRMLLAYIAAVD